jgi:hypothetical protein
MQYRIDHLENLKADVMDINTFPLLKIKGYVEDFEWGPMERIYIGDDGDVEPLAPDWNILNVNLEIDKLEQKMELIAGAPKEAMGIRSPGEKTKYEVQSLENASGRIFQSKLDLINDDIVEASLQGLLEEARRRMSSDTIRIFDDEAKVATFMTLTVSDITGNGMMRAIAAKHFAEYADKVQNITAFFNSGVGQDQSVNIHFSGLGIAKMMEELLELQGYALVTPFVRIAEMHEAQSLNNAGQEQVQMQAQAPSGLTPDDYTPSTVQANLRKAQASAPSQALAQSGVPNGQ